MQLELVGICEFNVAFKFSFLSFLRYTIDVLYSYKTFMMNGELSFVTFMSSVFSYFKRAASRYSISTIENGSYILKCYRSKQNEVYNKVVIRIEGEQSHIISHFLIHLILLSYFVGNIKDDHILISQ